MSGSLAGLYDPSTGLLRNRNDPRYAMAARLMDAKTPDAIPGKGAAVASTLGGVARAIAAAKLMGDAQQEGKDKAEAQRSSAADFMRGLGMGDAPAAPAPPAAPPEPSAPSPDAPPAAGNALSNAVLQNESGGRMEPGIMGDAGQAAGPMQVHQGALADVNAKLGTNYTHEQLAADPTIGKKVGDAYLGMQRDRFGRDDYAMGAYNAGPGAMQKAVDSGQGVAGLPASTQQYVAQGQARMGGAPQPAAPPPIGQQMADKLGANWTPTTSGTAMANRVSPETVQRLQQQALAAAQSDNPLIARMAPQLAHRAQFAASQMDREGNRADMAAERSRLEGIRRDDRAQHDAERGQDRTDMLQWRERQAQEARDARVPPGYRWNADHTGMEPVPGGPTTERALDRDAQRQWQEQQAADARAAREAAAAAARDAQVPPGYRWNADHSGMEPVPGGPATKTEATAPPTGFRRAADGQSLEAIPGGPADQTAKPAKAPSDTVVKGITANIASLRTLDTALASVAKTPDAFGGANYVPGMDRFAPEPNLAARAQVANLGSMIIHDRSGAAVTVAEMPRLAPFIPAATDPPAVVKTKLTELRNRAREVLQDQYDVYNPSNGYKAVPGHAQMLGLDADGKATQGADHGADAGLATPTAGPGGSAPASDATARRRAAVEAARAQLGPDATNEAIIFKAQELIGR